MFSTKGAMIGVAAAAVSALLVAGMAFSVTSGAATDGPPGDLAGFPSNFDIPAPGTDPGTGSPPAAPIEDPTGTTDPNAGNIDPNAGAPGAGASGPGSLPNAGTGSTGNTVAVAGLLALLAVAGAGLLGAGSAIVRRK
jgi:hypothetical protein